MKSLLNGFYSFIMFNIIYFLGRGLIYLLDILRGLDEDLIQGIGIEFIVAYIAGFYSVQTFSYGIKEGMFSFGSIAKFPKIVCITFITLIVYSRFFIFNDSNFFFYFKANKTLNIISVILVIIGAIIGSLKNEKHN